MIKTAWLFFTFMIGVVQLPDIPQFKSKAKMSITWQESLAEIQAL